MRENLVTLTLPEPETDWEKHICTVMHACWQFESSKRCTSFQVFSYLRQIYSLYSNVNSIESDEENFDVRWQKLKPNNIPKIDNGLPYSIPSPTENYKYNNDSVIDAQEYENPNINDNSSYRLAIPSDTTSVDSFLKDVKSESLNNLHGSFESVRERSLANPELNPESISTNPFISKPISETNDQYEVTKVMTPSLNSCLPSEDNSKSSIVSKESAEVAPWLQDVKFTSEEDMSYMKTVSDVISDLDNMLSSEKTSSSESSHQASPLRDISVASIAHKTTVETSNPILCKSEIPCEVSISESDVHLYNKIEKVPVHNEISAEKHLQPLDFRLNESEELQQETPSVFETRSVVNGSDFDSLQDSSYISDQLKLDDKTNIEADVWAVKRQYSSGSETEDEIWKKRIEMGTITEKIKSKSKSVTDLMILTHIDLDFTDLESDEASYTSFDFRNNLISNKPNKKSSNDTKEYSLPVDEYTSLKNNMISILNSNIDPAKNSVDIQKLKNQCKNAYMKVLRPTRSLNDLSQVANVDESEVKSKYQSFLDQKKYKKLFESTVNKTESNFQYDNDPFDHDCPKSFEIFNNLQHVNTMNVLKPNTNETESLYFPNTQFSLNSNKQIGDESDFSNISEEEQLKFSSNFNDINLNIYANEQKKVKNANFSESILENESVDSTVYMNLPDKISIPSLITADIDKEVFSTDKNITIPHDWTTEVITNFIKGEREQHKYEISTSTPQSSAVDEHKTPDLLASNAASLSELAVEISPIINTQLHNSSIVVIDSSENCKDQSIPNINISQTCNIQNKDECIKEIGAVNDAYLSNEDIEKFKETALKNLTSKLAMAENENNLNLEISTPQMVELIDDNDDYNEYNELLRVESLIDTIIMNSPRELADLNSSPCLIQPLSNAESLDEIPAASHIDDSNLNEDEDMPNYPPPPQIKEKCSGWFLHPKCESPNDLYNDGSEKINILPNNTIKGLDVCHAIVISNGDSTESLTENSSSDHINVDPESVQALRNELELKLPLAQKINQICHDDLSDDACDETETPDDVAQPCRKCPDEEKECLTDIQLETSKQPTREEVIHYVVPLSPIQEESWSEFSELERAAEMDKTDVSTSLSMHPVDEICDTVNATLVNQIDKKTKNPAEDEDSDASNRTFILCEDVVDNHNLNRKQSLSADSLNGYDDNLDLDDEEDEIEIKLKHVKLPLLNNSNIDLLSPHWEDKSQNKSTDEISHHVDDLLENISKTLENASKLGTTSLDVMPTLPNEELIEDVSELSLKEDDDSATYVIEDKRPTIKNLTDTYNTKVAELPEDISNVSKISQPSLVSDVATSNESDCNAKNSEKSISQNLHTKTPSIGSWCSNDTLFNVEENFDDVCYDFTPNSDPSKNSTLTQNHAENDDDSVSETTPKAYDVLENCANTFIKENGIHEVPQVETMVGHTENILHNISSPLNGQEDLLGSDNDDTKQSPSIYSSANAKSPSLSFEKYPLPELPLDSKSTDSPTVLHTARSSRTSDNETDLSSMCCSDTYQTAVTDKSESTLMFTCLEQLPRSIESSENELTTPTENKINFAHISSDMPVNLTECTELSPRNEKMSTNNHNNSIFYNVAFEHLEEDKVSTPVENHYMHDLTNDSLDLAGNLIDEHFKFLNSLDSPCTTGDSLLIDNSNKSNENINGKNFPSKHSDEENIVKSFLQNEINESNKSSDFHTEKSSLFSNSMPSSTSDNSDPKEIVNKKLHFSDCDEQQSENSFVPETEKSGDFLGLHSKSIDHADGDDSMALTEYAEYTGMNMEHVQNKTNLDKIKDCSAKDSPSFELFLKSANEVPQDLSIHNKEEIKINPPPVDFSSLDFNSINFTGPSNDDLVLDPVDDCDIISPRYIKKLEDIVNIPPELLKEWESSSDDSNCNSSSSGEFIWKDGDKEQTLSVAPAILYQTPPSTQQKTKCQDEIIPEVIPEEMISPSTESAGASGDEDVDFIPSRWDCLAIPGKSSLKNSETSPDNRKKVVFKQYYCVYEYPRDEMNVDESPQIPQIPNYASYNDWQTYDSYMDADGILNSIGGDFSQTYSNDVTMPSNDFYISSSARPFESFNLIGSSSQFFPGYRLSGINTDSEDFESLPIIPSASVEEVTNIDETTGNSINLSDPTQGLITPDSGTEDLTPASVLDEFSSDDGTIENISTNTLKCDNDNSIDTTLVEKEKDLTNKKDTQSRHFKGVLILPNRGSSSESTPSTPSPSIQSNSSGSLSPLNLQSPNTLGGLRHTRDKLKLDLPPSPLIRNSPVITSGKNSNKDIKIFDFKNISPYPSDEVKNGTDDDKAPNEQSIDNDLSKDPEFNTKEESLFEKLESDKNTLHNADSESSLLDESESLKEKTKEDQSLNSPEDTGSSSDILSVDLEPHTLQKAVVPLNGDDSKKVILEPVKGEGTLLDSGDEDSGIGSIAHTAIEKKLDIKGIEIEADNASH